MKTTRLLQITAIALACAATAANAAIIFQDDFNGTTGTTLNGAAPDVRPGFETWTSTTDTTYVAGEFVGTINAARSAYLAWTPSAGFVYTLQVDARLNSTHGGIATVGFFDNRITTTTAPNAGSPNDVRTPWLGLRNTGGALLRDRNEDGQGFTDKTTAADTSTIKFSDAPLLWEWNTLRLVLDTTGTDWTLAGYVTTGTTGGASASGKSFTQVGTTHTYTGNGGLNNVTRVGFSSIAGTTIQYDNFSLTAIPEPGTLALVGIALGSLLLFRRRR